jgi:hypothetical protein
MRARRTLKCYISLDFNSGELYQESPQGRYRASLPAVVFQPLKEKCRRSGAGGRGMGECPSGA